MGRMKGIEKVIKEEEMRGKSKKNKSTEKRMK
jgi:hypothetical protein